jgi:addiction module HigA family antidote
MASRRVNEYRPDVVSAPGESLQEALDERCMSQADLAERMGRPRKTVNEIVKGKAPITPDTALQLEMVLGIPASFWNNYERSYREYLARKDGDRELKERVGWLKGFPIRKMIELGWLTAKDDKVGQLRELLRYFAIASPDQWDTVWKNPRVAYRRSLAFKNSEKIESVWLRQGALQAQRIECAAFDASAFRRVLTHARGLTREQSSVFQPELVKMCAATGVAVVFVQELPGLRACGATQWLSPSKAVIQLSLRYRSDDQLWFSFFHEAGHIVLHGKKEVFIEGEGGTDPREEEANTFAANILIPRASFRAFAGSPASLRKESIRAFADEIGIAPGIVVGRLQKEGRIPYRNCNELKRRLGWKRAA